MTPAPIRNTKEAGVMTFVARCTTIQLWIRPSIEEFIDMWNLFNRIQGKKYFIGENLTTSQKKITGFTSKQTINLRAREY